MLNNKLILMKSNGKRLVLNSQESGKKKLIIVGASAAILTTSFGGVQAMGIKEMISSNDETAITIQVEDSGEGIQKGNMHLINDQMSADLVANDVFKNRFNIGSKEVFWAKVKEVAGDTNDEVSEKSKTAKIDQNAVGRKFTSVDITADAVAVLNEKDVQIAKKSAVLDGAKIVHPTEAKKLVKTTPSALTDRLVNIEHFSDDNMYTAGANGIVRDAEKEVKAAIANKYNGLSGYIELALAIAQKESGGSVEDIFQSSQAAGLPMNTLSREESIDWGLKKLEKAVNYFKENPEYDARYLFYAYNGGDGVYKEIEAVNGVFKIQYVQQMYDKFYKEGKARGEVFYQDKTPVAWLQVKFGDYTYAPVLMEFCSFDEEISDEPKTAGEYIKDATVEGKEVIVNVNDEDININEVNLAGLNPESANALLNQLKESGEYAVVKNNMLIALLSALESPKMDEMLSAEIKGKYLDHLVNYKDAIVNNEEEGLEELNNTLYSSSEDFFVKVGKKTYETSVVGLSKVKDPETNKSPYDNRIEAIEQAKQQYELIQKIPHDYSKVLIEINEELEAVKGTRIVLDSGHALKAGFGSGADPGAINIFKGEKNEAPLNIDMTKFLKEKLEAKGFEVVMINPLSGEHNYSKGERGKKANELDGDILLSIHHNSIGIAQRSEVVVAKNASAESLRMAEKFQQVQTEAIPTLTDGGIKEYDISMLGNFEYYDTEDTPAIIVEPLPISNAYGAALADHEVLVESLVNGYVNVLLEEYGHKTEKSSTQKNEEKETVEVIESVDEATNEETVVEVSKDEVTNDEPVVEESKDADVENEETPEVKEESREDDSKDTDTEVEETTEVKKEETKVEFSEDEKGNIRSFFENLLN